MCTTPSTFHMISTTTPYWARCVWTIGASRNPTTIRGTSATTGMLHMLQQRLETNSIDNNNDDDDGDLDGHVSTHRFLKQIRGKVRRTAGPRDRDLPAARFQT